MCESLSSDPVVVDPKDPVQVVLDNKEDFPRAEIIKNLGGKIISVDELKPEEKKS